MLSILRKFWPLIPLLAGGGIGIGVKQAAKGKAKSGIFTRVIEKNKGKHLIVASMDLNNLEKSKELWEKIKGIKPQYVGFESNLSGKKICENFGYKYPEKDWPHSIGWSSNLLADLSDEDKKEKNSKYQAWRCIFKS